MNFILMQARYPPAIIRQEMRRDYYLALEQADLENPDNFSELIVREILIDQNSLFTIRTIDAIIVKNQMHRREE